VDPHLPQDLIPVSPQSLYDTAHAVLNGHDVSAIAASPLQATPLLRVPESIETPDQLPHGLLLVSSSQRQLSFTTPSPFGFDLHWMREVAAGVLRGATGIRLDAGTQAVISAALAGRFLAAVTRDSIGDAPAIRLVLSSASATSVDAGASISARAEIPLPENPDDLLSCVAGIHPIQWAREVMNEIGSRRFSRIARNCGATPVHLETLLEAWRTMGARAESALWQALGSEPAWQGLRQWTSWLAAAAPAVEDLVSRVRETLTSDPNFATSPAARWLEAVTGVPLSSVPAVNSLHGLTTAASLIEQLAAEPALEQLMRKLPERAARELNLTRLWPWTRAKLTELLGVDPSKPALAAGLAPYLQMRDRAYAAARQALATKLKAEVSLLLSRVSRDNALADVTFAFTPEGLSLFRQVLAGDLAPLFQPSPQFHLRHGLLTHYLRRSRHIELHIPFLDRKDWETRRECIAQSEAVPTPDGRILVRFKAQAADVTLHAGSQSTLVLSAGISCRDGESIRDNFTLACTDERTLSSSTHQQAWFAVLDAYGVPRPALPGEPCKAVLSLSLPGAFAEAWSTAPHSRDEQYFPTMCRLSRCLQAMTRRWLPALYLSELDVYSTPSAVHPLLAWQCSQPYTGVKKGHLSYDFMDPDAVERAVNSALRSFPAALASVRQTLLAAGRTGAAAYYDPAEARYILASVLRQRRNFAALLTADAFFIEEAVRLADCARELRSLAATNPATAIRNLSRYSNSMVQAFHRRLCRLYARQDFLALGPLFLLEATAALHLNAPAPPRVAATLTLEYGGRTIVYHNDAAGIPV
jgi:hypothetical protein